MTWEMSYGMRGNGIKGHFKKIVIDNILLFGQIAKYILFLRERNYEKI